MKQTLALLAVILTQVFFISCKKNVHPECNTPLANVLYVVESGTQIPIANADVFLFRPSSWANEELVYVAQTNESGMCTWPCEAGASLVCAEGGDRYWDYCNSSTHELMQEPIANRIYQLRTKAWIRLHIPEVYFNGSDIHGNIKFVSPFAESSIEGGYFDGYVYYTFKSNGDILNKFDLRFENLNGELIRTETLELIPTAGDTLDYYYPWPQ
jgi:hypothetical protein